MSNPNDTTEFVAKTGVGLGAYGGVNTALTAGVISTGSGAPGTFLGTLAAKGLIGKSAIAFLAAHPIGLAVGGAVLCGWVRKNYGKK